MLLSLAGAAASVIFVATKLFSWQNIILLQQAYFCRDKRRVCDKNGTCGHSCQWYVTVFYSDHNMLNSNCLLVNKAQDFVAAVTCFFNHLKRSDLFLSI